MADPRPIAVLGCGAISEMTYLPALAANRDWLPRTWLIETNEARAHALATTFGFKPAQVVSSLEALPVPPALAINATPSHIHLSTTLAMIDKGSAVIVEKPLAENASDAHTMVDAARGRCVLSVNQSRRFGPSNQLVRDIVQSGKLGVIHRITWAEGHKFNWPSQSGFNFRRPWQGRPRGVLLDIGVHVIDLLAWWFGVTPIVLAAHMDGHGGPEAYATAKLVVGAASLDMTLSYLGKLTNQFEIEGSNGAVRGSTADYDRIKFRSGNGPWRSIKAPGSLDKVMAASRLIGNVLAASAGQGTLLIEAESALPALAVIDELYAKACDVVSACYGEFVNPPFPRATRFAEEMVA